MNERRPCDPATPEDRRSGAAGEEGPEQRVSRRGFVTGAVAAAAGLALPSSAAADRAAVRRGGPEPAVSVPVPAALPLDSYDPWIELDASAIHHNVREMSRLAGGTAILAVVKNNGYGLGDQVLGPLLAGFDEVAGIACVRVQEAVTMREAGVRKPILVMAEVTEDEAAELARLEVWPTYWLDDTAARVDRLARRMGRPIPAHLFIDTGMGREGMPHHRALPWLADLANRSSLRVDGTYQMFVHDLDYDREQLARFEALVAAARERGLPLGKLHASPTYEVFHLPEARFDMVRCSSGLLGLYPGGPGSRDMASLRPVFRMRARVTRVEQLRPGEGLSFRRPWVAERPTWIALLPVGHTDGYPASAAGSCDVLINGRIYPLVGGINSAHAYAALGDEKTAEVGDVATLIGPDDPAIDPATVAASTGTSYFQLITKLNSRLPRRLV
jgi:alanine racemase